MHRDTRKKNMGISDKIAVLVTGVGGGNGDRFSKLYEWQKTSMK
jgi:hypothetical protein